MLALATGWGALVVFYLGPGSGTLRTGLAWGFAALGLAAIAGMLARRTRRGAAVAFAGLFALALLLFAAETPSNEREWQTEVAVLPYATFDGDLVTVHNIRNFDYRSETDFTPAYYDRTVDLRKLDRLDLISVYWMGPAIAHVMLSFGFGEDHLAISIEVRKEESEPYSSVAGFFRQYEIVYIVSDERDVIRLRTNYRKDPPEDVYIYRATGDVENARRIFLDYMREINELRERPKWYNTLTTNCTTTILAHAGVNPGHVAMSWKVLVSGYAAEYLYEMGRLDQSFPFEELMRRSHVNAAAQAADAAPDFSQRIRVGLP
ncbi:MAG: DUF4105 domain-containing protein [Myxococcales bacterium]|nr:MAG: DUF4105 domain-containing protein [Myxococcales bacterium]